MRKTSILLALIMALALVLAAPLTAFAANVTIDLTNVNAQVAAGEYAVVNGVITVTAAHAAAGDTVTITGTGTNNGAGYSIEIIAAQKIEIAAGTIIVGVADKSALTVPAGAVITGGGADITISGTGSGDFSVGILADGGDVEIAGEVGDISSAASVGIYAAGGSVLISGTVGYISSISASGDVEISGQVGEISGNVNGITAGGAVDISGDVDEISGAAGEGISAGGNVEISGTVTGDISGTNGSGILAAGGDVEISGTVGDISGSVGISAGGNIMITDAATVGDISGKGNGILADGAVTGDVTIEGRVGKISATAAGSFGIAAKYSVTISGTVTGDISGGEYGIYARNGAVTISGTATVGDISGGKYGIHAFYGDVTIAGSATVDNISATAADSYGIYAIGSVTIAGSATVDNISATAAGSYGIYAEGSVTIAGSATVGNISGGSGDSGRGIYVYDGNVEISGTAGNISGGERGISANAVTISGTAGNISGTAADSHGIFTDGSVTITGKVSTISGASCGIAANAVTISGTAGNISGTSASGISTTTDLTISGTAGNIRGGECGIFTDNGNVTISGTAGNISGASGIAVITGNVIITGKVNKISGVRYAIFAGGYYAALDYNGSLLNIAKCEPAGYTVTFNYGTLAPADAPKKAYISEGNLIPSFTVPDTSDKAFVGWYKEAALENSWNFNNDSVTANITLYAKWSGNNSNREGRDDYNGSTPSTPNTATTAKNQPPVTNANPFTDVKPGDWFYEHVMFVYTHGLMNGTGDNTFSPNATLTRAMFITILARLFGVDTTGGETWYAKAVEWAVAEGITDGVNLHDPITREQIAVMLQRYAQLPIPADPAAFADDAQISDYARDAVYAMQGAGVVGGKPGNLIDPQGFATRAEAAKMLQRLAEALAGK